ncbi:hypothetical protein [Mycolicibacterium sp. HS_4_1]
MGSVVYQSKRQRTRDTPLPAEYSQNPVHGMAELVEQCSELIGSAIAPDLYKLGGTERDIERLAKSAAYAIVAWSAGEAIGG